MTDTLTPSKDMTHPDDLVDMLINLAREHGYGLTEVELINMKTSTGQTLPRYSYSRDVVETVDIYGNVSALL